ncbi:hypothetical protein Ccrd_026599 [Cynara cardunculus var. scolymus]|uniref:Stress regulated protein n=1 Tax=Cynara cardunculus var. scolymus TaxID=59895 RepID=A0A103XD40_CYNCS|nr:hypothetical protein Ccrd_026599 [Cynara cardunculus var. scolymus]
MNGGLLLSAYPNTGPQWSLKRILRGTATSNSRYMINRNVKSLSSSSEAETGVSGELRREILEQVDKELSKGDDRAARSLVKDLHSKPGGLRCFGAAQQKGHDATDNGSEAQLQFAPASSRGLFGEEDTSCQRLHVPQRLYSLNELKLNGIETSYLLSPKDNTLGAIERNLLIAALLGFISAWSVFDLGPEELLYFSLGLFFLWTLDSVCVLKLLAVSFGGGFSSLVLDTIGHKISQKYHNRVIQHEAGHFLIAYLLGILPKGYTLSSLEAFQQEGSLNVQAGTTFVDFEFTDEISAGRVSATMLNKFSCIALAGVATEYLLYGYAEGGLADVSTLDGLLNSLGFTQKKADSQVRWAVLNTILILRRHEQARAHLAKAMSEGKSIASCIDVIEKSIDETCI